MSTLAGLLTRPVTYLRVAFLLIGSALALSFMLLDFTLITLFEPYMPAPWLTVVCGAVLVVVPPVALGLMPPARQVEAVAAESLLGVRFPDGTPGPARHWEEQVRTAMWFVLHVFVGGVVVVAVISLIPIGLTLALAPFTHAAGEPVFSLGWLRPTGGWVDGWMPIVGLGCWLVLGASIIALGWLLARWAPTLLGPSYTERLERLEAETARLAERNRIARELHDSVGHALSLVTLQASAARKVLGRDPAFVDTALDTIESTARAATADLDHMLGVLRDAGTATRDRAPDLTELDALLAATRAAGLDIHTDLSGVLDDMPGVVSDEAYRIVQEALTNALRHASEPTASLRIARGADRLTIVLENPTTSGSADGASRPGRGLRGIEERARALGGTMTATTTGANWRVAVELPLPRTEERHG